ncbi:MAG: hypothetical protein LBP23_03030 [Treponema sp.]|jgi:hypothetical protein|nr:hypothetical protein [Treponema sp.]
MSCGKLLFIVVFLAAGLGILLYALALALMPPGTGKRYAALSFDESVPDRRIGELLSAVTEDHISESTQYVFLDDFGVLKEIPLDQYGKLVEPFDPRNDGYAEKLRSFFVRDGRRFFFIPLGGPVFSGGRTAGRSAVFERRVASLFNGIPFSVEYSGGGKPFFLWLALAAGAGIGVLFLWKPRFPAVVSLPVLCALSPGGPPALALGAILAGLLFLLAEPAGEFFIFLRYRRCGSGFSDPAGRNARNILTPLRFRLILGAFLLTAYGGGCAAGGIPPLLGIAVFAASSGLVTLALLAESIRGEAQDHVRFLPVIIMAPPSPAPAFSRIVLVYFLAAVLGAVAPLLFPGIRPVTVSEPFTGGLLPSEEEYLRHAAFQVNFSWRPLGGGDGVYRHYSTGEDGLLSEAPGTERALPPVPPFPLKELAAFLDDPAGGRDPLEDAGTLWRVPFLLALILAVPALRGPAWGRNKKKKMVVYAEKRIAA